MFKSIKRIALAGLVATMALPAAAATFDFTGGNNGAIGNYNGNYTATVDGITVDVLAGNYRGPNAFDDSIRNLDCSVTGACSRVVTKRANGLGVGGPIDGGAVDGFLGNDLITFVFDSTVDFVTVRFTAVDGNDDFDLFIDGSLVAEEVNIRAENPFSFSRFSPSGGTSFSLGADGVFDDFRIASIEVAAVPLPAGFALLLTGLGGLGLMRRRAA